MKTLKYFVIGLTALLTFNSCGESFFDTEYTTYLGEEEAQTAAGRNPDVFTNGMWSWNVAYQGRHDSFGFMSVCKYLEVMGEDIAFQTSSWFNYDYQLDYRLEQWVRTSTIWTHFYTLITKANEVIALYPNGGETAGEKGLLGQAYAIRGMSYYYLIQIYQDYLAANGTSFNMDAPGVPIMYNAADGKTEEEMAAAKGRNTVADVLEFTQMNLEKGVELLSDGFVRKNKNSIDVSVANGLLARFYLLTQQWQKAADAANAARQGYTIMDKTALMSGFNDVSNGEWMWGFNHTTETSTSYASFLSHMDCDNVGYGRNYPFLIDAKLYDEISETDYRKALFNGPEGDPSATYAGAKRPWAARKFKMKDSFLGDYIYMRAAEMVLIEAEAYAHLGNGSKAATVLKELMSKRDPEWNESSVDVEDVYLQRRIELWGEGFTYFDLKRLNKGIARNYQGTNHNYRFVVPAHDVRWTFQIPRSEIQENDRIDQSEQNP